MCTINFTDVQLQSCTKISVLIDCIPREPVINPENTTVSHDENAENNNNTELIENIAYSQQSGNEYHDEKKSSIDQPKMHNSAQKHETNDKIMSNESVDEKGRLSLTNKMCNLKIT